VVTPRAQCLALEKAEANGTVLKNEANQQECQKACQGDQAREIQVNIQQFHALTLEQARMQSK